MTPSSPSQLTLSGIRTTWRVLAVAAAIVVGGCRRSETPAQPPTAEEQRLVTKLLSRLERPHEPSQEALERARGSLGPHHHWVLDAIAELRTETGRDSEASLRPLLALARRWRDVWPDEPDLQVGIDQLVWRIHESHPALKEADADWRQDLIGRAEELVERSPRHPKALTHLAVLLPADREDEALRLLARCATQHPTDAWCKEQWQLVGSDYTTPHCKDGRPHPDLTATSGATVLFRASDVDSAHATPDGTVRLNLNETAGTRLEAFSVEHVGDPVELRGAGGTVIVRAKIVEKLGARVSVRSELPAARTRELVCKSVARQSWPKGLPPQPSAPPDP